MVGSEREVDRRTDDTWITPAERADFETTPSYTGTRAWLERLAAARPGEPLTLALSADRSARVRTVVIASGARYRRLAIADLAEFEGGGVSK